MKCGSQIGRVFIVNLCLLAPLVEAGLTVVEHGLYSAGHGNLLGVAYNPDLDHIYLSQGSDGRGGYIYTIDLDGNLLDTWNFPAAYVSIPNKNSFPTAISYDTGTNHLFVVAFRVDTWEYRLLEMSTDGATIYNDYNLTGSGYRADGLYVDTGGIWLCDFFADSVTHLSMAGAFLGQFAVDGFPEGYPGPADLAGSFDAGFFLFDDSGTRIVEVDGSGSYVSEFSTMAGHWDGRGGAIDSDLGSRRIFVNDDASLYIITEGGLPPYIEPELRDVIPAPSAILLGSIGVGFVSWLRRRRAFWQP